MKKCMNKLNPFKLYKRWVLADIISLMKRSIFIPIPEKDTAKKCSNYRIVLISHASRVMLRILQARLMQYVNWELPGVKLAFREGRGTRDQIANIHWFIENGRALQKNIYFCFIDYVKAFDCGSQKTGKFFKRWKEIPGCLTCLMRNLCAAQEAAVRIGHGTMDWFKIEKGVWQGYILSPCSFNLHMQSTSCEMLGWMNHKLESRLLGEISTTSDMQMTPLKYHFRK